MSGTFGVFNNDIAFHGLPHPLFEDKNHESVLQRKGNFSYEKNTPKRSLYIQSIIIKQLMMHVGFTTKFFLVIPFILRLRKGLLKKIDNVRWWIVWMSGLFKSILSSLGTRLTRVSCFLANIGQSSWSHWSLLVLKVATPLELVE